MFRVLNISGLMQHAYECEGQRGTIWQITQLGLAGGRESSGERWDVRLTDGNRETLIGWQNFLDDYRVVGENASTVRLFLTEQLQALKRELAQLGRSAKRKRFSRRRDRSAPVAHRLWQHNDRLRSWFMPSLTVEQRELARNARETLRPIVEGLDHDAGRIALRDETESGISKTGELVLPEANAADDYEPEQWRVLEEKIARVLDQALGGSRHLLTLTDRYSNPAGVESVLASILSGAITAFLTERAHETLSEPPLHLSVGFGNPPLPGSGAGDRYEGSWTSSIPVWSVESPEPISIHVHCILSVSARNDRTRLGSLLALVRQLFGEWLAARQTPLAQRNAGWTGLMEMAEWDPDAFQRWRAEATPDELIKQLRAIGRSQAKGPSIVEKQTAWNAVLEHVLTTLDDLSLVGWTCLLHGPPLGDPIRIGRARTPLKQIAVGRVEERSIPSGQARDWTELWLQYALGESPDTRAIHPMITAWKARCHATRSRADDDTLFELWSRTGRLSDFVPDVAGCSTWTGKAGLERAEALAAILPEPDERRQAALALTACLRATDNKGSTDPRLAFIALSQTTSGPPAWVFEESDR
ncbi:MAG: hypothetical protein AAF492_03745, partial [Verrucomicrobiota bacterium]